MADEYVDRVIAMLRVVRAEDAAGAGDHDLAELVNVQEGVLLQPHCEINGLPLVGFRFHGHANLALPGLYDIDDECFLHAELLATSSWYSESGGAPISWGGGNRLERLPGGVIIATQWGDSGHEVRAHRLRSSRNRPAEFISRWVSDTNASVAAALALEPLNLPPGTPKDETDAWADRLEVEMSFTLNRAPEEVEAVRRLLRRNDPCYRLVAAGLARPRSAAGRRLAGALDDVLGDGDLGHLREMEVELA